MKCNNLIKTKNNQTISPPPPPLSCSLHISPTHGLWLLKELYCDFIGKPIGNNFLHTFFSQHNNTVFLSLVEAERKSPGGADCDGDGGPHLNNWRTHNYVGFNTSCWSAISTLGQETQLNTDHKQFCMKAEKGAFYSSTMLNCLRYVLLWSPIRVSLVILDCEFSRL